VVCSAVMKDETDSRHNRPFFQKTRGKPERLTPCF
jgi:hypothetical protein